MQKIKKKSIKKKKENSIISTKYETNNNNCIHIMEVKLIKKKKESNAYHICQFMLDLFFKLPKNTIVILDNIYIHHINNLQSIFEIRQITYAIKPDHITYKKGTI